ncbi:hypothetical protein KGF54_004176 [Candida jiufengensis]|uniref:uncharacterized protein n=1 Tax=Candida jiufengensis TaxID=497108 RepID=UPI0022253C65|nr:uncharacterized protein KGF54_004176 [Candida jiufengensis]KAI5951102.1 hypothetical protein KGF54_004176 [Candida jiufengensis]
MYASTDLYPRGLHHLWTQDQSPKEPKQFAPPLASYTAEFPGPDPLKLNRSNDLSILIKIKQEQLDKIRNTGYSTIRPIGIGKTMEEIDYMKQQTTSSIDDELNDHIIEAAENTNEEELDTLPLQQDLDAQILNADETINSEDFEDDEDSFSDGPGFLVPGPPQLQQHQQLDDEGFMAADVEYQDDHSLNSETNTNILMNSGVTTGLITQRTSTTNPTTAPSLRTVEERYVDENEYSEQDMVVD